MLFSAWFERCFCDIHLPLGPQTRKGYSIFVWVLFFRNNIPKLYYRSIRLHLGKLSLVL